MEAPPNKGGLGFLLLRLATSCGCQGDGPILVQDEIVVHEHETVSAESLSCLMWHATILEKLQEFSYALNPRERPGRFSAA